MSNLFKKVTSTVSVLAIAASAMGATASVSAASEFLTYADMLAKAGVINSQTEAGYRLGDNITRAEVAKIAVKLSGVEMYDCVGDVFSDVGPSLGDLCSAIETAAAEGFVNANADKFRPTDKVTRAEMVKMLLAANGVESSDKASSFKDIASIGDLAGYINAGVEIGAIKDGEYFRPNANATRGEAFKVSSVVMDSVEPTTPPTNGTGTTTPPTTSTGTTSTGVVTAGGLTISNDAMGMQYVPKVGTIKAGKYSFAAASSDVTLKSIKMKRGGLGQRDGIDSVWFEYNGKRVTTQASVNSDETVTLSFTPAWKIMAGTTGTLDLIVKLRSPGVSGAQHNFAIVAAKDIVLLLLLLLQHSLLYQILLLLQTILLLKVDFESVSAPTQKMLRLVKRMLFSVNSV
ncbi:MAG: S-layer homology domain-containing protein [Candidatus Gracilibacteria bacterium]